MLGRSQHTPITTTIHLYQVLEILRDNLRKVSPQGRKEKCQFFYNLKNLIEVDFGSYKGNPEQYLQASLILVQYLTNATTQYYVHKLTVLTADVLHPEEAIGLL